MSRVVRKVVLCLFVLATHVKAQVTGADGDEICSCSPTVFSFTLDFAGSCPGTIDAADNDAIEQTTCDVLVVSPDDQSNTQPVIVDTVTILELNQNEVINSTTLQGPFADGEVIEYASISIYRNLTETYFPFGLQLILRGENSDTTTLINAIAIDYDTSECDVWPVFSSDSSIGWIQIDTVEDAIRKYCPAAPATPTVAPSLAPVVETTMTTSAPATETTTTAAATATTVADTTTVVSGETTTVSPPVEGTSTSAAPVDVPASTSVGPPTSASTTVDAGTTTTAGPPVDGPTISTTADPPIDAPVTTTPVATTIAPALGGSTVAPIDGGTPTAAPIPVAVPTIVPVDQPTQEPTPDEPPFPLPPIMFPTVDSPTSPFDPPPASFSKDSEDE